MQYETEKRHLSKAPLILLVMLVTTAAPLLVLAEERADPADRDESETIDETVDETADEIVDEIVVQGRLTRYSATKSDTPIMETARSVSIEDRQQLVDKGAINLADTYLYTAGVFGEHALAPAALGVNVTLVAAAVVFAWLAHRPAPGAMQEKAIGTA